MSKNPTAQQKRMWGRVFENGCMACQKECRFSFPQIHHWRPYGYRDHSKIFGLCPAHHSAVCAVPGIPNRHLTPVEFAKKYGTDEELFKLCMEQIGEVK
jgi:hypothetical protein